MKISQMCPFIGMEEYDSIKECFEINWLTEGPKAKQFVSELCETIGVKYGVLAPNGTLALYLGLKAIGIKEGDEVIVPNFTFIASATAVLMAGGTPIFVDVDATDLQIDISKCESLLTSKTKAIMPVHIFGAASNMDEVVEFAYFNNLEIIEDAAQAMGVTWKGKHCGGFGEVGCFSFFADKTITTVEGGFVGTNDEKIYHSLMYLRNQGRLDRGTFIHPEIGFNFRMNDMQAAIGLVQLSKKELIYEKKLELYQAYCEQLSEVDQVRVLQAKQGSNIIPFRACVLPSEGKEGLEKFLIDNDIEARTFFYPLNRQPCFSFLSNTQDLSDKNFTNSIDAFDKGICLPIYPSLLLEEVTYICDTIKAYYGI